MKTAMILAAGRGERLRPITDHIPKALCLIGEKPLIAYHIEKLVCAGFEHLIINHAHLGGQIKQYVGNGNHWGIEISYSPEPPGALETGGGIVQALSLLGKEPFATVNADIFTDYDFCNLQLSKDHLAHLVLVNKAQYHKKADFNLSTSALLENENPLYTFTGIACYHPQAFKGCQIGRFSVTPLIRKWASEKKATGELHQGKWYDIGTSERLLSLNETYLSPASGAVD